MPGLRPPTTRGMHAACPPPMRRTGGAQAWPTRVPRSRIVAVAAPMPRVASAWEAGRRGPPVAYPWPTRGPGGAQAWAGPLPGVMF